MKTVVEHKISRWVCHLLSIIIWIGLWQIAAVSLDKEIFLPAPAKVLRVLFTELIFSENFRISIGTSLFHIGMGFLFGALGGIALAMLSFRSEIIRIFLAFPMKVVQSAPVASVVILILLWIPAYKLSIVIPLLMVLPALYIHTLAGLDQTDAGLLEMAQVFHVSKWKKLIHIYLPCVAPYLISACRMASGMAWKSGIAAEIIGLAKGTIGHELYQVKIYLETPELFAWIIVVTGLCAAFEALIRIVEAHVIRR